MFTYKDYYELITALLGDDGNKLYLRHDVDISLKKAVQMAEKEYNLSVGPGVYFILITGDFYNPFDKDNTRRIKQILDMGHKIGYHYDLSMMPEDPLEQSKRITSECLLLNYIFDVDINAISCHKPYMGVKPSYELLAGMQASGLNDPNFTLRKGYKYISDSAMNFREDIPKVMEEYNNFHLNIHPEWWAEKEGTFQDRLHDLQLDLDIDSKVYKEIYSIQSHHERLRNETENKCENQY